MKERSLCLVGLSGRGEGEAKVLLGSGTSGARERLLWGTRERGRGESERMCVCKAQSTHLHWTEWEGEAGRPGLIGHIKMFFVWIYGFFACFSTSFSKQKKATKSVRGTTAHEWICSFPISVKRVQVYVLYTYSGRKQQKVL